MQNNRFDTPTNRRTNFKSSEGEERCRNVDAERNRICLYCAVKLKKRQIKYCSQKCFKPGRLKFKSYLSKEKFLDQLQIIEDEYGEIRFRWWYMYFYSKLSVKSANRKWCRRMKKVKDLFWIENEYGYSFKLNRSCGTYKKYTLK